MKKLFMIFLLLFATTMIHAQVEEHDEHDGNDHAEGEHGEHDEHEHEEETIHGNVFVLNEKGKKEGLEGAVVIWKGTQQGALTNAKGHFHLEHNESQDTLLIMFVGFATDTIKVDHEQHELSITLEPSLMTGVNIIAEIEATRMTLKNAQLSQVMGEKELCKAACCNLSESFETNASIDASFTDAITGTRQIKMLGLDGRYTQIMFDNVPTVRGLASIYGLSYLPGPWIKEISISKGVGSVISGHESITGQINVAHKTSDMVERLFVNAYYGSQGRMEINAVAKQKLGERWNSLLFLHGAQAQQRFDMNKDGFLDNPLFQNLVVKNDWEYVGKKGIRGNYSASYHHLSNTSGQYDYDPSDEVRRQLWGVNIETQRAEVSAKTGYVFEEKDGMSIGTQFSASYHDQSGNYGSRIYDGVQLNLRGNVMFASEYNESIKQTSGISYVQDDYQEQLGVFNFDRTEQTFGLFTEHTFNYKELLSVIVGLRGDYHNTYGFFATPRLHARYSFNELTTLKFSVGKGYRSPNLLMDNVGMFASNRVIQIEAVDGDTPYGMKMEDALNTGLVFTKKFKMFHRDATIALDLYRTDFNDQIVVDWETPIVIKFYQLDGKSYSNSAQVELQWSPLRRLNMRTAYRWLEAKTMYGEELLMRPLIAQHRAFMNLDYSTKEKENGAKWMFDFTARWLGKQRLPDTSTNPHHYMLHPYSEAYYIFNAQVSRHFNKNFEIYVGGENLGNFMQMNPIISADNPDSQYFDASLIYGPVFGRMGYVGLRWRIA